MDSTLGPHVVLTPRRGMPDPSREVIHGSANEAGAHRPCHDVAQWPIAASKEGDRYSDEHADAWAGYHPFASLPVLLGGSHAFHGSPGPEGMEGRTRPSG